jgi:hypothetical protein
MLIYVDLGDEWGVEPVVVDVGLGTKFPTLPLYLKRIIRLPMEFQLSRSTSRRSILETTKIGAMAFGFTDIEKKDITAASKTSSFINLEFRPEGFR